MGKKIRIDYNITFGERLRAIRESQGLTQAELSELSEFHPTQISHYEVGERSPSIENLIHLCEVLVVTPNELLGVKHG